MKTITLSLLFIYIFILDCHSQSLDSAALKFKAQLLTTSRFGLANTDSLLSEISKQRVTFLKSAYSNTILIKVEFGQRFFTGKTEEHILWLGNCSYYVAYNIRKYKFYRLGGFDVLDIDEFFDDFQNTDNLLSRSELNENPEIDFSCLRDYADTPLRKRRKKAQCLPICSSVLKVNLIVH